MGTFKKYFFTLTLFLVLHMSLIGTVLLLKQSGIQSGWEQYVASYDNFAGFRQFILSAPRRLSFLICASFYCYFWARFERLDYSITSFLRNKWYCLRYYGAGICLAFGLYFLSEVFYLISGSAHLKALNITWVIQSGFFVLLFSTMSSFAEEVIFRKVLLESFQKKTNSFLIANLLQAVLFAAVHLSNPHANIVFFFSWIVNGILLGFLKNHSQSIAFPIGFHTGFHANCLFMSFIEHTELRMYMNGSFTYHMLTLGIISYAFVQSLQQGSKNNSSLSK